MATCIIEIREHPANDVGAHWAAYVRRGVFSRSLDPMAEGDTLQMLLEKLVGPWAHVQPSVYVTDQSLEGTADRCLICGHAGLDYDEMPSMMGYGSDGSTSCPNCHATQTDNPMSGLGAIIVSLAQFGLRDQVLHTERS